jgi:hypothetical protein
MFSEIFISSVTGRAALLGFHSHVLNELFAFDLLQISRFHGVRAPLPAQIRDLVHGPDVRRRVAMAIEAETHA